MALVNVYGGLPITTQAVLHGAGAAILWGVLTFEDKIRDQIGQQIDTTAFYYEPVVFFVMYSLIVIILPTLAVEIYKQTQR